MGDIVNQASKFLTESGINASSHAAHEYRVVTKALQLGVVVDGYNVRNSAMCEWLARRRQLIEHAHSVNAKEPDWTGSEHWMGTEERKAGAILVPTLHQHVSSEWGKEAAIMKEKRKAREAAQAASKTARGGGT